MSAIEHRGAHAAVWQARPDVWLTALWDVPEPGDIVDMVRAWEHVLGFGLPYRSLVDVSRVRRVDPMSFATMVGALRRLRAELSRLLVRQVILRPEGIVGAVSGGILTVAGYDRPMRVFTDVREGLPWLLSGDDGLTAPYLAWVDSVAGLPAVVRRLRAELMNRLPDVNLATAARGLATSARTLQRQLGSANTTFQAQLDWVRVERAKELLAHTDDKIATIAHRVGYESEGRFCELFRDATDATPLEWRAQRR